MRRSIKVPSDKKLKSQMGFRHISKIYSKKLNGLLNKFKIVSKYIPTYFKTSKNKQKKLQIKTKQFLFYLDCNTIENN